MSSVKYGQATIYAMRWGNTVCIDTCRAGSETDMYRKYARGDAPGVESLPSNADAKPEMYLLYSALLNDYERIRYRVAWMRYFMNWGYRVVGPETVLSFARNLTAETTAILNSIGEIPLDTVLARDKLITPAQQAARGAKRTKNQINISISVMLEEYDIIARRAREQGVSISAYGRSMLLHGTVINVKPLAITRIIDDIRAACQILIDTAVSGRFDAAHATQLHNAAMILRAEIVALRDTIRAYVDMLRAHLIH